MYTLTYTHLYKKYPLDNFEQVMAVMERHFNDMFQLGVLDEQARLRKTSGYMDFFAKCLSAVKELYTEEEVAQKLFTYLNEPEVYKFWIEHFNFVPAGSSMGLAPKQLGILEKWATGQLKVAEPVSLLDMQRAVSGLCEMKKTNISRIDLSPITKTLHLAHLHLFNNMPNKNTYRILVVNFNLDLKATPKWGVIDARRAKKAVVYCESALQENEKKALEDLLESVLGNRDAYEEIPARADSLPSTGYAALAWLDNNVFKAWHFNVNADFTALLAHFVFVTFAGDNTGIPFHFKNQERNFCTPEFKHILSLAPHKDRPNTHNPNSPYLGYMSHVLAEIAALGRVEGTNIPSFSLQGVTNIIGGKQLQKEKIDALRFQVGRTSPAGFTNTLVAGKYIQETSDTITLRVPERIDTHTLLLTHMQECEKTNTNSRLLKQISDREIEAFPKKNPDLDTQQSFASIMVLTTIRTRAKKENIRITLPDHYQLSQGDQDFIVNAMINNAYVAEFILDAPNKTLNAVKERLIPVFARNRWLTANNYLPPLIDNFWQQAAKFWLIHLNSHDVLSSLNEQDLFKRCIREMGITGLEEVLVFLRDEAQQELLTRLYGENKPAFYAACPAREYKVYLGALLKHLREKHYFPFKELGFSYQPGNDLDLLNLLSEINALDHFSQITFSDCLVNKVALNDFLDQLMRMARVNNWSSLIVIPELEDKKNLTPDLRAVVNKYNLINNIILTNAQRKSASTVLARIQDVSDFTLNDDEAIYFDAEDGENNVATDSSLQENFIERAKTVLGADSRWPLTRDGAVQLQIQQQQEIQQSRQIQQEQQKVVVNTLESALVRPLVSYGNIDSLMQVFFEKYQRENTLSPNACPLKLTTESQLQGFFHTWINANPNVIAQHVIQKMTVEAVKILINRHERLPSGLSVNNLPKGFYTQRSKDGELVLCYDAELSYANMPNPLTLKLDVRAPVAELWEGDFRQFNLEKYLTSSPSRTVPALDEYDWESIKLFAKLQPPKVSYEENYNLFVQNHPSQAALIDSKKEKIVKYWLLFLQVWQYPLPISLQVFVEKIASDEASLQMTLEEARTALLRNQAIDLQEWAESLIVDENYLRALGQIYYRYKDEGVTLLLRKFKQLEVTLGYNFFACINQQVFRVSTNFNCFMVESFFIALDEMMVKLKPSTAQGKLQAWQVILVAHTKAVGWEDLSALWAGFQYFSDELEAMGLSLNGNEFNGCEQENMLVCMDRLLSSLRCIPVLEVQRHLLRNLASLDRTYGGVHYALQHERFKYFADELQLTNFNSGTPTYAPDLKALYTWPAEESVLRMKRSLASQPQFSHHTHAILAHELDDAKISSKHKLMWLLHTQYDALDISLTLKKLQAIDSSYLAVIAQHLHEAVYELNSQELTISLNALEAAQAFSTQILALLPRYKHGTLLEAINILHQMNLFKPANINQLLALFSASIGRPDNLSEHFYRESYKLAVLFGATKDTAALTNFFNATNNLLPVIQNELRLLITHLLAVSYEQTDSNALTRPENWESLLKCIEAMKKTPACASAHRFALINYLVEQGIKFKYSKNGAFRALKNTDDDKPADLNFFVDHYERLWTFLQAHIAVPLHCKGEEALQPVMRFLKTLQLNRTYLNEIEPFLSSLESTDKDKYWSASYFYGLLRALQPQTDRASFPITLLKKMLEESIICAKSIDDIEENFPKLLAQSLQLILENETFNRVEQGLLAQLALREFKWQGGIVLVHKIMAVLKNPACQNSRRYALEILERCSNFAELETQFENCQWLLQHPSTAEIISLKAEVIALWLKALSCREEQGVLFVKIKQELNYNPQKQALILHIVAFSSLRQSLKDGETYLNELNNKTEKLVQRLSVMDNADLIKLALCYPHEPSPSADDILRRLIKQKETTDLSWDECLDAFMRQPYPEPRNDYGKVANTREMDLQRMIADTKASNDHGKVGLSVHQSVRLNFIFSFLKQLENGEVLYAGKDESKAICKMTPEELATRFNNLSHQSITAPDDDLLRTQIWAILFEVLGRTTRKYPHLAQQFALIANDLCIEAPSRVIQLATGEGKSHFVALRAARHVGQGKSVDVCTAKRTLAERDLEDYKSFFNYLKISSAYIHPKSSHETYVNTKVHYSTLGDLSLFLDEQSYTGQTIYIDPRNRVGLFDEFDFMCFEEGRKTEYNYARPTGKTPKQMTWFYQAVNAFYREHQVDLSHTQVINFDLLEQFVHILVKKAGQDEEKQNFVKSFMQDPLQLVQWIQSAAVTQTLEWGTHFTVREEEIAVGEEAYPMREIIPLSKDMQKMIGSTFSAGVQQLLAIRMNTEAKAKNEPQNFHIHSESNIVSSQVAAQRMQKIWGTWEGFSGTISTAQIATLHAHYGTVVLHVPTNQRDLRVWIKPTFFAEETARVKTLIKCIQTCLKNKHSILFSCKDDRHVHLLKSQLTQALTADELENFIFYTNEEHRTAAQVLDDKYKRERWHGGKKQQAVGLVASGFGRGDNVGVEAVFLFDVNDTNDKLQKGGRTARNGARGNVFQFYLLPELMQEKQRLMESLPSLLEEDEARAVQRQLEEIPGDENEQCFEQVMLLREYIFSLQNAGNEQYHKVLAQLSTWGMDIIGQIADPTVRDEATIFFTKQHKILAKKWIDISSKSSSLEDKIKLVSTVAYESANNFANHVDQYMGKGHVINPLQLEEYKAIHHYLGIARPAPLSEIENSIASICMILRQWFDLDLADSQFGEVPRLLDILATNPEKFKRFTLGCHSFSTYAQFIERLRIAVIQVQSPSLAWDAAYEGGAKRMDAGALLQDVSGPLKEAYYQCSNGLHPQLQETLTKVLCAANLQATEKRIEQILPLLDYLNQLSVTQQVMWGEAFLLNKDHIFSAYLIDHVLTYLANCPPTSFEHFISLWKLAVAVCTEEDELLPVLAILQSLLVDSPEQRMRALTQWEIWTTLRDQSSAKQSLMHFCNVMMQFKEGENWDTFAKLIQRTHAWWNKGAEGKYQVDINALWQHLDESGLSLIELNDFLQWGLSLRGKAWLYVLTIGLKTGCQPILTNHLEMLKTMWVSGEKPKGYALKRFEIFCSELAKIYKIVCNQSEEVSTQTITMLTDLTFEKLKILAATVAENFEMYSEYPQLLPALLMSIHKPTISLAKSNAFAQLLRSSVASEYESPGSIDGLIGILDTHQKTFEAMPDDDCVTLFQLMGTRIALLLKQPQLMESMLVCFTTFKQHAEALCMVLLTAAAAQECYPETFRQFVDCTFSEGATLNKLSPANIEFFVEQINTNIALFLQHPEILKQLLDMLISANISGQMKTIEIPIRLIMQHSRARLALRLPDNLANLLHGFKVFMSKHKLTDDTVEFFKTLMNNPRLEDVSDFFLNNTVPQLVSIKSMHSRLSRQSAIHTFHQAARDCHGHPPLMMESDLVSNLFKFASDEPMVNRLARITWMKNLYSSGGQFTIHESDQHIYSWNDAKNDQLITLALNKYVERAKAILASKPQEKDVYKSRDLNQAQQIALLQLSNELRLCANPTVLLKTQDSNENVRALETDLAEKIRCYESSWFISSERRENCNNLKNTVTQLLQNNPLHGLNTRYEQVIAEIQKAKDEAIASDKHLNKNRWFKVNRSGSSRYFNTLNQMQDLVLRQWSQDQMSVQRFALYQDKAENEFQQLTLQLCDVVTTYYQQTYVNDKISISQYFWSSYDKDKRDIATFQETLENFLALPEFKADEISVMLTQLTSIRSRLPGHINALANELMIRGEALSEHAKRSI